LLSQSSANSSPAKPSPSPKTSSKPVVESEFLFDEQMIREQMEIERELARRRENEGRNDEENQRLLEISAETNAVEAEVKNAAAESAVKRKVQSKPELSESANPKEPEPKPKTPPPPSPDPVDHERIVARIIEEKIAEKLGSLQLNSGSN